MYSLTGNPYVSVKMTCITLFSQRSRNMGECSVLCVMTAVVHDSMQVTASNGTAIQRARMFANHWKVISAKYVPTNARDLRSALNRNFTRLELAPANGHQA